MKKILLSISILSILIIMSCGEDEDCTENAKVNGECFKAVASDYDIFSTGTDRDESEYVTIIIQFANGSERYRFSLWANRIDGNPSSDDQVDRFLFEEGINYQNTSFFFNGNLNGPASGELIVNFLNVDRADGSISGAFTFFAPENDLDDEININGSFTDVAVSLVSE